MAEGRIANKSDYHMEYQPRKTLNFTEKIIFSKCKFKREEKVFFRNKGLEIILQSFKWKIENKNKQNFICRGLNFVGKFFSLLVLST